MQPIKKHLKKHIFFSAISLLILSAVWTWLGVSTFSLNADVSRDLSELSSLWVGKIVWLGPQLSVGFPISPLYFYLLMPMLIVSGGSAYSLVLSQVFLAVVSLGTILVLSKREDLSGSYLAVLFLGFSSWWIGSTINPWNGNMYVAWLLLAITLLWFKKKLWVSLLIFGVSVAVHPAALLVAPIFLYETIVSRSFKLYQRIVFFVGGLVVPWAPIIAFEFITKGFLTRQWLVQRGVGMSFMVGLENSTAVFSLLGLPVVLVLALLLVSLMKGGRRVVQWYFLLIPTFLFLSIVSPLHYYYLLGVVALITFLITQSISRYKVGKVLLVIGILFFLQSMLRVYSFDFSTIKNTRYQLLTKVVDTIIENKTVVSGKKYALISVIDHSNSTPQADDYRFMLRTKNFQASNITEYPHSDYLLIFFENDQKNPEQWHDWHSDYFGDKELVSSQVVDSVRVLLYRRK